MTARKLVLEAYDDGVTLELSILEYERVGGTLVGPTLIDERQLMSCPERSVEEWRKQVAEMLSRQL